MSESAPPNSPASNEELRRAHWVTAGGLGAIAAILHAPNLILWALGRHSPGEDLMALACLVQYASPVILGVLAARESASGAIGRALKLSFFSLLVALPLMGEGLICLILLVPWFLVIAPLVAAISVWVNSRFRRPSSGAGANLLLWTAIVAGSLPTARERAQEPSISITNSVIVAGSRSAVWASIDQLHMPMETELPLLHRWLLPIPTAIDGGGADVGSVRTVSFNNGTVVATVNASSDPSSFAFELETHATGPEFFDHYVKLERSEFNFTDAGNGATRIEHTTRYQPLAYPRRYFEPLERALGGYLQGALLTAYEQRMAGEPRVAAR